MSDWKDSIRRLPFVGRRPTTVVAATGDPQVLAFLWERPDLRVREARTTDAVNSLLAEAQLVILDPAALRAGQVNGDYIYAALAGRHVPHTDPADLPGRSRALAGGGRRPSAAPCAACRRAWWPSPRWPPAAWARRP